MSWTGGSDAVQRARRAYLSGEPVVGVLLLLLADPLYFEVLPDPHDPDSLSLLLWRWSGWICRGGGVSGVCLFELTIEHGPARSVEHRGIRSQRQLLVSRIRTERQFRVEEPEVAGGGVDVLEPAVDSPAKGGTGGPTDRLRMIAIACDTQTKQSSEVARGAS